MKLTTHTEVVLKILSNVHRYNIMKVLFNTKKDLCVNEIAHAVGISQSLTSQHLSHLQAHGLIVGHRIGQTICYMPSRESVTKQAKQIIQTLS